MFVGAGGAQQFGPLGVLTPYPGLTSLWPGGTPPIDEMGEGSLWSLASSGPAISVNVLHNGTSNTAKELESVKLVDGKLKVSINYSFDSLHLLGQVEWGADVLHSVGTHTSVG